MIDQKRLQEIDDSLFAASQAQYQKYPAPDTVHPPILLVYVKDKIEPQLLPVGAMMQDEASKDMLGVLQRYILAQPEVELIALVSEAWMLVRFTAGEPEADLPRPSQSPDRIETLMVAYSFAGGGNTMVHHGITRSDGPVQLTRGKLNEGWSKLAGRFVPESVQH